MEIVKNLLRIRLKNYGLNEEELATMIETSYRHLAAEVGIVSFFHKANIDENNRVCLTHNDKDVILMDVYNITDDCGDTVDIFEEIDENVYKVKDCENCDPYNYTILNRIEDSYTMGNTHYCGNGIFSNCREQMEYTFHRKAIAKYELLDERTKAMIMPALIAGTIYYTQGMIPTPTQSASPTGEESLEYRIFLDEIARLKNKMPERR